MFGRDVRKNNQPVNNFSTNEMAIHFNVFGLLMKGWILCKLYSGLIITVGGKRQRYA